MQRETAKLIASTIGENLDGITQALREQGIDARLSVKHTSYGSGNAVVKLQVNLVDDAGEEQTPEAGDFKIFHRRYGLPAEALGRTFRHGGDRYTLIGCKPRATRFPLLGKRERDGKVFKFAASSDLATQLATYRVVASPCNAPCSLEREEGGVHPLSNGKPGYEVLTNGKSVSGFFDTDEEALYCIDSYRDGSGGISVRVGEV